MRPAPFVWYQKKGCVILNIFCSTSHQIFFITFVLHACTLSFFWPAEIYWFRLISTLKRLPRQTIRSRALFLDICCSTYPIKIELPVKSYGNRLISKHNRPSWLATRAAGLFLDIIWKNLVNWTTFCSTCINKIFTIKKSLRSTYIDTKLTLQASHDCRGPVSWYRSIEHEKLNNFFLHDLTKNFQWKVTEIVLHRQKSSLQASYKSRGPIFMIPFDRSW